MPPRAVGILQIITAAVCWGTLGLVSTRLHQWYFSAAQVAAVRIVGALMVLLVLLPLFWPYLRQLPRRQLPFLAAQSMLGMLGMSWFYFAAVAHAGSAVAVALLYMAPVWSLILARLILHEGITPPQAALTVLAATGVALTMAANHSVEPIGLLYGLLSGLCYALYGVLGKRAMQGNPPLLVLFTSIAISALLLLGTPLPYRAAAQLWQTPDVRVWLYAAALVLMGTLLPYLLFIKGLEKMTAAQASVFTIIEPLTAVLLAVWWLNEHLSAWQMLGVLLIVTAAGANALLPRPSERTQTG